MQTDHVIAQCAWQSTFDQQGRAIELQNFISQWSNSVLREELEQCFNRLCPATQIWRVNTLGLDLGDILLDELPQQLPKRLKACLDETLSRMLTHQKFSIGSDDNLRILDQVESYEEFVIWFLLNGSVPWWFKGDRSALQILDRLMVQSARSLTGIVRNLGRSEAVRKRLVRQLGDARVRAVIHLLEPWHGDFICAYADNLFTLQIQRQLPASGSQEFRDVTWLTILTHLLVDRGTLFNTVAFARANLLQTAHHYRIDYRQLLEQMYQAVLALAPAGVISHRFFTAIKTIYQRDYGSPESAALDAEPAVDYWVPFQAMLHNSARHRHVAQETVQLDELFSALAEQDVGRMARLLRQEGKSHSVRQGILQHFSAAQLERLVCVLEPQDHLFIVAHAHHTQALADLQHWGGGAIWEVLLAYLLAERGSYFNRRQLVHHTLLQVCKAHRFDYALLLDLLIHSVQVEHPSHHRFDLLAIFRQLQGELPEQRTSFEPHYRDVMLHYLKTGDYRGFEGVRPAHQSIADRLLSGSARLADRRQSLVALLCADQLQQTNDSILSRRLLELVGAAEFPRLLNLLQPDAGDFCASLAGSLLQWQRQAYLPGLAGADVAFELPAMIIQSLPGFYQGRRGKNATFDLAQFWRRFTALLAKHVDIAAFHRQLTYCMNQRGGSTVVGSLLGSILSDDAISDDWSSALTEIITAPLPGSLQTPASRTAAAQETGTVDSSAEIPWKWSQIQLVEALRLRLSQQRSSDDMPQELSGMSIETLWRHLEHNGSAAISNWIERQPDKYYLLQLLTRQRHIQPIDRWLLEQLPDELNPPDETLKHWSAILLRSGCWQGASAVLEAQLSEVFWAVSFDAASKNLPVAQLLVRMATCACLRLDIRPADCVAGFRSQTQLLQKTHWRNAYMLMSMQPTGKDLLFVSHKKTREAGQDQQITPDNHFRQDYLARYLAHPRFIEMARHLLQHGRAPLRVDSRQSIDLTRLLFDVLTVRPDLLPELLKNSQPAAMFRLSNIVPFGWLIDAMRAMAPDEHSGIAMLERFWQCLMQIRLPDVSRQQRTAMLFHLTLKHWLNRACLAPEKLVGDFLWQLLSRHSVGKAAMRLALEPHIAMLPKILRYSIEQVMQDDVDPKLNKREQGAQSMRTVKPEQKLNDAIKSVQAQRCFATPMRIDNAGLVILQSFIGPLFSRLGLTANNRFVSDLAQRRAVHYLQFLVSGCGETQEHHLMLNKLLCGLELDVPVELGVELSTDEVEVCLSLLNSVIGYWSAIGSSSIDGFRGNWLVRDGSLTYAKDHWDLIVDRRAYDLLLSRAPFSYSVIKLPWMEKAIYVTWPGLLDLLLN
jgi:hypothetical protein